jgi:hypothetical protein
VYAESLAAKKTLSSMHGFAQELRKKLLANGVMVDVGNAYSFTQDYVFNSPSTAAVILLGRSANGRLEWQDDQGRTLKAQQQEQASGLTPG